MKTKATKSLPDIVSSAGWEKAHQKFLVKEKAATKERDRLAAERRRLPMTEITQDYVFHSPAGKVGLLELFAGRRQLILYHFMFARDVDGWPDAACPGCSLFLDQVGRLEHLRARDTSFAVVSLAPLKNIQRYKKRMEWNVPWFSSDGSTFNADFGLTTDEGEDHGLSVFIHDGRKIYRTYFTQARGLEYVGSVWSFLDLTPLGRQEKWEDTPPGRVKQSAPYTWWRRHDEY
jgi:predicted dithiol-disulfide oxidoreductase (DUF899 family)